MAKHHFHATIEGLTAEQAAQLANDFAEAIEGFSAPVGDYDLHVRGTPYIGIKRLNRWAATYPLLSVNWWSSRKSICKRTKAATL